MGLIRGGSNKGDGGVFVTKMDDARTTTAPLGEIPIGTTVSALKDRSFSSILSQALFPLQYASIVTPASLMLSYFDVSTVEVGASYAPTVTASLNKGAINHGTGSYAGSVVGDMTAFSVENPDGAVSSDSAAPFSVVSPVYTFTSVGQKTWTLTGAHATGDTTYEDGEGNEVASTIIDAAMAKTTTVKTYNRSAAFKRFTHTGSRGSSPATSVAIRALPSAFLSTNNTANYTTTVAANTPEFTLYVPAGKTADFLNKKTNASMNVSPVSVSVNDAGGTTQSYDMYILNLGLAGFTTSFELQVGIS